MTNDGRHDFDFLFGRWRVHNRMLKAAPAGEWSEFEMSGDARPLLGGIGNMDEVVGTLPSGKHFEGMSLRLFEPEDNVWRIWWASTTVPGRLDPPVVGRFVDGRGEFVGDDVIGGKPAKVRFEWSGTSTESPRWQQEFSFDDGKTWDPPNWIMTFTRAT